MPEHDDQYELLAAASTDPDFQLVIANAMTMQLIRRVVVSQID